MKLNTEFCCAAFDLEYRFATTYSLLCLHVWLALVRLRVEGKDGKDLAQMMYDNFQEDVELRVRAEGVKVIAIPSLTCFYSAHALSHRTVKQRSMSFCKHHIQLSRGLLLI